MFERIHLGSIEVSEVFTCPMRSIKAIKAKLNPQEMWECAHYKSHNILQNAK